jgi:hypothetical protein
MTVTKRNLFSRYELPLGLFTPDMFASIRVFGMAAWTFQSKPVVIVTDYERSPVRRHEASPRIAVGGGVLLND